MSGIARVGDKAIGRCKCHSPKKKMTGVIITGSPDTFVNGRAVARIGDVVRAKCGHKGIIVSGSPDVITDGQGTARLGDKTTGCFIATIITASEDTFAD